jgi:hypothetical protein
MLADVRQGVRDCASIGYPAMYDVSPLQFRIKMVLKSALNREERFAWWGYFTLAAISLFAEEAAIVPRLIACYLF